jgi:hypothetical protein
MPQMLAQLDTGSVILSGEKDIDDEPYSSCLAMAAMMATKDKVDAPIQHDCHTTESELCTATGIGKPAVMSVITEHGYREVCARWVPNMLNVKHTTAWNICAELLQCSEKDGDAFLSRIITDNETWVHHYDPLTNNQWNGIHNCHHEKKVKV